MRAALHLGNHRQAEGLPAQQFLFPQRRTALSRRRRSLRGAPRRGAPHHAASVLPHERACRVDHGDDPLRRLPGAARPLPSAHLVARRRYLGRYDRSLPGRHAGRVVEPPEKHPAHRVRFGFGANANPKDHAAFEARFGFPLIEAWAMTETGGGAMIAASREPRHVGTRCIGFPERPGLEDRRKRRAARAPGRRRSAARVLFRLPQGRRGHRARLARRLVPHRRLGARGPDGALHFVDRLKNIIRRAGENIAALEVEAALAGHPAIAQAAVIAVPDPLRDEEVMACVVLQPEQSASRDIAISIQDWCLERLAYFKALGACRLRRFRPPPRPTRCKRPSSPISPSMRPTPSTCVSERREPREKRMTVALAAPVMPYVRYSIRAAHWWLARVFKDPRHGHACKSKTSTASPCRASLAPDGHRPHQHLGFRRAGWITSRSAERAEWWLLAQRRGHSDADIVACIGGDTNHVDSFRLTLANFSQFARDAVYPYGAGGPNASFAFLTAHYMRRTARRARILASSASRSAPTRSSIPMRSSRSGSPWRSTWRRGRSPSRCTFSTA